MVVKWKKKPPVKAQGPRRDDTIMGALHKEDALVGWSVRHTPQASNINAGKDMKRKVEPLRGSNGTNLVSPQLNLGLGDQNSPLVSKNKNDLVRNHGGALKSSQSHDLNSNSLGWESRPWPSKPTTCSQTQSLPLPAFDFHFGANSSADGSVNCKVGNLPQRKGNSIWRQNDRRHPERSNRYNGLVRCGSNGSLEEPLSTYRGECSFGLSSTGGRSLEFDPKPILPLPRGQGKVPTSYCNSLASTRQSLMEAPLRKISKRLEGDSSGTSHILKEGFAGQTHRTSAHGEFIQGETIAVLDDSHSMHTKHTQ